MRGRFGDYGGAYVPETLVRALHELVEHYEAAKDDESFQRELDHMLTHFVGRPTPLYEAERLT